MTHIELRCVRCNRTFVLRGRWLRYCPGCRRAIVAEAVAGVKKLRGAA